MAFTEDPDVFYADFGVPVVFGAYETLAHFNQPGVQVLGGVGIATELSINYASIRLPGLARNSSITVDGVAYQVREVFAQDDGAHSYATLVPA